MASVASVAGGVASEAVASKGEGVASVASVGVAGGAEPAALQLGQAGQVVRGLATSKTHCNQRHIQHSGY